MSAQLTPGAGPGWEIAIYSGGQEILKEVGPMGRFLFDIAERPGLGIDATRIRSTLAAAPELLAALTCARIVVKRSVEAGEAPEGLLRSIDAAIAKARGDA